MEGKDYLRPVTEIALDQKAQDSKVETLTLNGEPPGFVPEITSEEVVISHGRGKDQTSED